MAAKFKPKQKSAEGKRKTRPWSKSDVEVFKSKARARRKARIRGGWEIDLFANRPWVIGFDARLLVEHAANANAVNTYEGLDEGVDLETGRRRKPAKTSKDPRRMIRTGRFRDMVRRTKVTGNETRARTTVKSIGGKQGYDKVLRNEAKRGQRYFSVRRDQARVIEEALHQVVVAGVKGKARRPNVRMRKAKQMLSDGK